MKKVFPTLYAKASTGKIKVWKIRAEGNKTGAFIVTDYGYEDSEELQSTTVEVNKGKNIGRANETTPFEQACLEAESKWNKKQDKKYTTDSSGESNILLPMLALDYKKRGKDIEWPALIQPKLDGVRCLARREGKEIHYTSRGGKVFENVGHITPMLLKLMKDGEVFDGELFTVHLTFQETVSAVKRKQDNTEKVQLHVYDIVNDDPFYKRNKTLHERAQIQKKSFSRPKEFLDQWPVQFLTALEVSGEKKMLQWHALWTQGQPLKNVDGEVIGPGPDPFYEGTIIRNRGGKYKKDFRSKDLQKYKDFIDEEFEIVGAKEGKGKFKGAVVWLCVQEEGKEFECTPKGTMEQKQDWWKNRKKYFGKWITVRYQTRTDENKPLFPVGLAIRDYE
jgi:DNA ligase-1